jgi:3-oxoacid CoA-transferase subunit B
LERCTLPLTGVGCIDRVVTDFGVLDVIKGTHFRLLEWAPDLTPEAVVRATGAKVEIAPDAKPMKID